MKRDTGVSADLRLPITIDRLALLVEALPHISSSSFESALFRAAFLFSFFGFLRISEVAATSKLKVQASMLRRSDISFPIINGSSVVLINFRVSKNHQFGGPQEVLISPQNNKCICPIHALHCYLIQSSGSDVLFVHFDGSPLTQFQFKAMLKRAVAFCKFPHQDLFKSHSFRIGAATTARMCGMSDSDIQTMGHGRSSSFARYIRIPTFHSI